MRRLVTSGTLFAIAEARSYMRYSPIVRSEYSLRARRTLERPRSSIAALALHPIDAHGERPGAVQPVLGVHAARSGQRKRIAVDLGDRAATQRCFEVRMVAQRQLKVMVGDDAHLE